MRITDLRKARQSKALLNYGGERGIRTLDTGVSPYNGLANRRLQPLGHLSAYRIQRFPRRTASSCVRSVCPTKFSLELKHHVLQVLRNCLDVVFASHGR